MIKVVALGDVHDAFPMVWRALRASAAMTDEGTPSAVLEAGRIQVVLLGDLVHYKTREAYAKAIGEATFDPSNPEHLQRAADVQLRDVRRLHAFVEAAQGHVHVLLGNHDAAELEGTPRLSTRGGLPHDEFDPEKGGVALPTDVRNWLETFPREVVLHGVQFAHAGPTPSLQQYDDFFYGDADTKRWWYEKPHWVRDVGFRFGVYGHTPMPEGVWIDQEHGLAMIDALGQGEFLELMLDEERLDVHVARLASR